MTLLEGKKGETFTIVNILVESKVRKRLQDMGVTVGAEVKVMSKYANNAFILQIRGSRVVLGNELVSMLEVKASDAEQIHRRVMIERNEAI